MRIDIGYVLGKSTEVIQQNPAIFVPSSLPFFIGLILGLLGISSKTFFVHPALGIPNIFGAILLILVACIAEGAIVFMTKEQLEGKKVSYTEGIGVAAQRLGDLVVASVIIAIGAFVGLVLLVIPGLVWLLLVAFSIQIVMLENLDGVEAVKRSIKLVRENFGDVFVFLLVLLIILLIVSIVLGLIPVIGSALASLVTTTYSGVALTVGYLQLRSES